jgi:hypothetical protein
MHWTGNLRACARAPRCGGEPKSAPSRSSAYGAPPVLRVLPRLDATRSDVLHRPVPGSLVRAARTSIVLSVEKQPRGFDATEGYSKLGPRCESWLKTG